METKKKSLNYYMRALHRDLGFLTIGLVLVYALSGLVLVFRDTPFMKQDVTIEKTLPTQLDNDELAAQLRLRNFKVTGMEGETVVFKEGTYNRATGKVNYMQTTYVAPLDRFVGLHKTASKGNVVHWASVVLAVALCLLALTSFWMFKPSSRLFKRGMALTVAGVALAVAVLWLL